MRYLATLACGLAFGSFALSVAQAQSLDAPRPPAPTDQSPIAPSDGSMGSALDLAISDGSGGRKESPRLEYTPNSSTGALLIPPTDRQGQINLDGDPTNAER